jgi:hypothetical protein
MLHIIEKQLNKIFFQFKNGFVLWHFLPLYTLKNAKKQALKSLLYY